MPADAMTALPVLGAGLGYRMAIAEQIDAHADEIDWLELITEHFMWAPPERLEALDVLASKFPLVPHGLDLSIGSDEPLDAQYLDALGRLLERLRPPWFSDHLCFTRAGGVQLGTLTPLPRTTAMARAVAAKVRELESAVGVPFILENITYYLPVGHELTDAQFLTEVLSHCDAGLLLDVTNVYNNATNHGYDPYEFLGTIPLERVVQVHLAGGVTNDDGSLLDSHDQPVVEDVWRLFEHMCERADVRATLIERDDHFPDDFAELTAEVRRAGRIMRSAAAGSTSR
jgi:uncharacterized protein (UPF0276 family)